MRMLDERVRLDPARREDHDRGDSNADRAEEVGEDVPERRVDVEAMRSCAGEHEAGDDVDGEAEERDHEHPAAEGVTAGRGGA